MGSPATADGSSYSGLCHRHEYFTSLFFFNLKSFDHNLSWNQDISAHRNGWQLYQSCSTGNKVFFIGVFFFYFLSWIFNLQKSLLVVNLRRYYSSPHEWFLTLKLIDVDLLPGSFGILYFNEVKKTWKWKLQSQRQRHLAVSCRRGVFTTVPVVLHSNPVFPNFLGPRIAERCYLVQHKVLIFQYFCLCSKVLRRPRYSGQRTEGRTQFHLQIHGDI